MMRKITLTLIASLLPQIGYCQTSSDSLHERVIFAIAHNDAAALTSRDYEEIQNKITRGDTEYISLYPELTQEPFLGAAAFQEGIDTALALALTVNTPATLKQVTPHNINIVCGMPFIEPTEKMIERYYTSAHAQLAGTGKSGAACLDILEGQMKDIKAADKAGKMEWGEDEF
jgi:hypothetical protein